MLIIYLAIMLLMCKYGPIVRNKINTEYETRFNFELLSKENSKKLCVGSAVILFGNIYRLSNSEDKISGVILILIGVGIILSKIYEVYKKTNLKFGLFAAFLYLIIVCLQLLLGVFVIIGFVFLLLMMSRERHYRI